MIRRTVTIDSGQPGWMLISQVEHARLSGEMAEAWIKHSPAFPTSPTLDILPLAARAELLPAIYHHDDGWAQWEQTPQVDRRTGRPLAFTEMPISTALAIWRGSIARAEQIGPLAAWVVAGHFTALLSRSHDANQPPATVWLREFATQRQQWLANWQTLEPTGHSLAESETALAQLQLFDLLSLWLCMEERTATHEFTTPGGRTLTCSPEPKTEGTDSTPIHRQTIRLAPWPLEVEQFALSVSGRVVPARAYRDEADLAQVPRVTGELSWNFLPG